MDMSDGHQACDGLDFIVEHPEYVAKLATALSSIGPSAIRVRKQMFELLAALCAHNEEGRIRTLETLEYYKALKKQKHRMAFIVQELEQTRISDYQTALVAFINCLVISTSNLRDRVRIRNEFIECQLLEVLNRMRKSDPQPDLTAQLDVFEEQHKSDESEQRLESKNVDLDSPLDVFYAILKQVADGPHAVPFLNILHNLLSIDANDPLSDIVWDNVDKAVQRGTMTREEAPRLSRFNSKSQLRLNCTCQQKPESGSGSRRTSLLGALSPPPPPPGPAGPPPPPPPFPQPVPTPPAIPPPPPPSQAMRQAANLPEPPEKEPLIERLPQQEIPAPKSKMKTVNWNKIPSNKIVSTNNIWTQVAVRHQNSPLADIDWSEMEGLFCQQGPAAVEAVNSVANYGNRCVPKARKDNQEISLLDGKRSLNVNIFLKQFRSSNEDIIRLIKHGEHDKIGIEKLKGLLKILPEVDELDMLKSFDGDWRKLGNAEKFLIQLTSLSNYKLRIESMLLKEEFESNMSYVKPSIHSMIIAAQELMTNKALQEVLYMVLIAGNFLNAGGYAGNAAGVKLSSLQKIMDIRANKPNMNLIHFVALQAEKRGNILLSFTDNIGILEEAAKTTVEQLKNEISALEERIRKIRKQIELPETEPEIEIQMTDFLIVAGNDVSKLQKELKRLDTVRQQLAEFFCEDLSSFKIEECFRIFHAFTCKFKQAVIENERRKFQEQKVNARKRGGNLGNAADDGFIEMQIYDSGTGGGSKKGYRLGTDSGTSEDEFFGTSSPLLPRHRLSSFNGNGVDTEQMSPDSSPNGSLRRRRSKGMLDDQGNLMDFLRNSCDSRERKSWGSLDRSWARKAKGTGPKKRPALLTADFLLERDRATPSPMVEVKGSCSAPEDESKKDKVESWLKGSEFSHPMTESRDSPHYKDKSAWRKSTLNVPNSTEEIGENHRRDPYNLKILQPILETTNDRKELIGSLGRNLKTDNKLTLYIRKPLDEPQVEPAKIESPPTKSSPEPPVSNKIEIDQDNVQTPPMARKNFISPTPTEKREPSKPSPCSRTLKPEKDELDLIGDGQFNRFSPARRTRRQVRNQPKSPVKIPKEEEDVSSLGDFVSPVCIKVEPEDFRPKASQPTNSEPARPRKNSLADKNTKNQKNAVKPNLRRTPSLNSSKGKITGSRSAESFKMLQTGAENGASKPPAKISARAKPMGFMKPTTASTTKASTSSTRKSFSLRGKD
ncbi:hypothetical protein HUJ04_011938 [Dendroctonus ponderosae]|nr:hypothetical protein HUJ04_011938 [Dendroctonus ponderosae]KAH1022553.1 hypothetical protein HUJ04_011938 [Dendroctonus ponderosae]